MTSARPWHAERLRMPNWRKKRRWRQRPTTSWRRYGSLSRLDPLAGRSRTAAREEVRRAETLMRQLHAPPHWRWLPVSAAALRLSGALPTSGEAGTLAFFQPPGGPDGVVAERV